MGIHQKATTDSQVSPNVEKTATAPSLGTPPICQTDTPMPGSYTALNLGPTPRHLAKLQIILKQQPNLDQIDRHFNRQIEALKAQQNQGSGTSLEHQDVQPPIPTPQVVAGCLL